MVSAPGYAEESFLLCEHLLQVISLEILVGIQYLSKGEWTRAGFCTVTPEVVLPSDYRTDYLAIPSENKENCAVPVEE